MVSGFGGRSLILNRFKSETHGFTNRPLVLKPGLLRTAAARTESDQTTVLRRVCPSPLPEAGDRDDDEDDMLGRIS